MRPRTWALVAISLLALTRGALAREIHIHADGGGDYETIQDGILAAQPGDEIVVGPGTYTWTSQHPWTYPFGNGGVGSDFGMLVFWVSDRPDITVRSSDGPEATILDAEGQGRHVFTNNAASVDVHITIDGFTFRNARRTEADETPGGGAMIFHLVYPTVLNCIFEDNEAVRGAGIYLPNARDTLIENCQFRSNFGEEGPGITLVNSNAQTVIRDCLFEDNRAMFGGAILVFNAEAEISGSTFLRNTATTRGAAIYTLFSKPLAIENCWMEDNISPGATLYAGWDDRFPSTDLTVESTAILYNEASGIQTVTGVDVSANCVNSFGNLSGMNWEGTASSHDGQSGNLSANPVRCVQHPDPYAVRDDSPMLAINNPDCTEDIAFVYSACEAVDDPDPEEPTVFQMHAGFPNPFDPSETELRWNFEIPGGGPAAVDIYNVAGDHIRSLTPESDHVTWDGLDHQGRAVASGVYVARLQAGSFGASRRVVVIR